MNKEVDLPKEFYSLNPAMKARIIREDLESLVSTIRFSELLLILKGASFLDTTGNQIQDGMVSVDISYKENRRQKVKDIIDLQKRNVNKKSVKSSGNLCKGVLIGKWIYTYKNSLLGHVDWNENGVFEGKLVDYSTKTFYKVNEYSFKNGKMDGPQYQYRYDGEFKKVFHCENGLKHGERRYYSQCNVVCVGTWENDVPVGYNHVFDPDTGKIECFSQCHKTKQLLDGFIVKYEQFLLMKKANTPIQLRVDTLLSSISEKVQLPDGVSNINILSLGKILMANGYPRVTLDNEGIPTYYKNNGVLFSQALLYCKEEEGEQPNIEYGFVFYGKKHGTWHYIDKDYCFKELRFYHKGKLHGPQRFFDAQKQQTKMQIFEHGVLKKEIVYNPITQAIQHISFYEQSVGTSSAIQTMKSKELIFDEKTGLCTQEHIFEDRILLKRRDIDSSILKNGEPIITKETLYYEGMASSTPLKKEVRIYTRDSNNTMVRKERYSPDGVKL